MNSRTTSMIVPARRITQGLGLRAHGLVFGLALLGLAAFIGCMAKVTPKHYFLMTYAQPEPPPQPKYSFTVRVKDFNVSPTYNRTQIVYRYSLHELEYYNHLLWTEKPQKMISDLVRKSIARAGLFSAVTAKLGDTAPDFTLTGEIDALEELDSDEIWYAHLAMNMYLQRFSDNAVVWNYTFDQRRQVMVKEPRIIVRTLSEIMATEMKTIISGLDQFLAGYTPATPVPANQNHVTEPISPIAPAQPSAAPADIDTIPESTSGENGAFFFEPGESPWFDHPSFLADTTPIPAGKGALFLPALSQPDREPVVMVYQNHKKIATAAMGTRIVLRPGRYSVKFGSGTLEQLLSAQALIKEQLVTVVEPFWAALDIKVVDEHFIPFRGTYELMTIPKREEYGTGFGADEERAEEAQVWILPPGLFKIVRAGGTYRDRTNFATVSLTAGQLTSFTLVLDQASGNFLGAGIIEEGEGIELSKRWKFRSLIGGDVLFQNQTETATGNPAGWTTNGNLFFDSMANFKYDQHRLALRLEIEEGMIKESGAKTRTLNDRFYFHSIYTYLLKEKFGPYLRFGAETALTNRTYYFENNQPHQVFISRPNEDRTETYYEAEGVVIGRPFTPHQLKEGLGGNVNLYSSEYLDLSVRLGLGARQYYARDYLTLTDETETEAYFNEVDDYQLEGIETAFVAFARTTRYISWSCDFDSLFPLDEPDDYILTLRNVVSLRLVSFASLNYKFELNRDPFVNHEHPTWSQHQFLVRFSVNLF